MKDSEGYALFEIADDGVGMDEVRLAEILRKSQEYRKPGERSETGVGLMNINKRLTALYGYGLDIRSCIGKGTQVSFRIPKRKG